MRRILRIWPVYFLIGFLGFFIFPKIGLLGIPHKTWEASSHLWIKIFLYLTFLPHAAVMLFNTLSPYVGVSWSVGVEEQFYLIWPWVLKFTKRYLSMFLGIILLFFVISYFVIFVAYNDTRFIMFKLLLGYLNLSHINCMATGGIGAYILFFDKKKILKIIYTRSKINLRF